MDPRRLQKLQDDGVCKKNFFVNCDGSGRQCHKCGWNPEVSEIRRERIRLKFEKRKKVFVWEWRSIK